MRIVSAAPSNTEIIYKLGLQSKLVGTTSLCDFPQQALEKPNIGGWSHNINFERINKLKPDIILLSDRLQDSHASKLIRESYEILHVNPNNLEEVFESIQTIGERFNKEKKALEIVSEMKEMINQVELQNKRIYCEEWMDPPMVSGNWIPGLIEKAGGNYFIEEGRSRKFNLKELKDFDPEYIYLNVCGAGENIKPEEVLKREQWQDITAVKNENIYVVNDALLNRPTHRLIEGALRIESSIY